VGGAVVDAAWLFTLNLVVTIIQIICYPINQLVITAFPSIATYLTDMSTQLLSMLEFLPWLLTYFPWPARVLVVFIMSTELVLIVLFQSTYYVSKAWKIFQRIKFW